MFSNFTWTADYLSVEERAIVRHWTVDEHAGVFVTLTAFAAFTFAFSVIASTLPVPSGSFIPVFKIGAAFGRMVGEAMHLMFPRGLRYGGHIASIVPGGYATVGAAAFSGAVTRTISVSVIVFEMTGQITHIIPIMIAVLVSNAVAGLLGPSIYDSIILIKRLPYLPDLLPASGAGAYDLCVEDFMVRDVRYVYKGITYRKMKDILLSARRLRSLPLVDSPDSMVLLGSVRRPDLIALVEKHVGRERRLQVAAERQREKMQIQQQRRPSRFRVEPAPADALLRPISASGPKKSILKKTNSFTTVSASGASIAGGNTANFWSTSPTATPYQTVTGAESRVRMAFEAIFRKSSQLQDVDTGNGEADALVTERPAIPLPSKKVQLPRERVIDMSPEDQRHWEDEEMARPVELADCRVDPAPFQLVERTSLLKVK